MENKICYIVESYRDYNKTLHESFMVHADEVRRTDGFVLRFYRSKINPNLKWHYKTEYLDKNHELIRREQFNKDGECIDSTEFK